MKIILKLLLIYIVFIVNLAAQTPASININLGSPVRTIPRDFLGFSFGRTALDPGFQGANGYFFDSTDTQLLTLFKQIGIRNLRIGGSPVDTHPTPSPDEVDALFRFAKADSLRIIYSYRLENGDSVKDASLAKYIWNNYKQYIDYYAVGNEPDIYRGGDPEITGYSTYLAKWRRFTTVILDSVPNAIFGGPDIAGTGWYSNFASDEANSGFLKSVFSHYYVNDGGGSTGKTYSVLADNMLSASWDGSRYPNRYDATGKVASQFALSYRLTEANSYSGTGPCNIFASSLFGVDFLYWWALHGGSNMQGIDIHCNMDRLNTTIYAGIDGYEVYPLAYGLKAFSLGGHGNIYPVSIGNIYQLNLTAYTSGSTDSLYVTIINKEHGSTARDAQVTISSSSSVLPKNVSVMYLTALGNNPEAITGVRLGGGTINNYGTFQGRWTLLDTTVSGSYIINVPATSAAVVLFSKQISGVSPAVPVPLSPNAQTGLSYRPTLLWGGSSGADSYRIQVSSDTAFGNIIVDTALADTSLKLPISLDPLTEYYWRVSASNKVYSSIFSPADSFETTIPVPDKPELLSPAAYTGGVDRRPAFEWRRSSLARSYEFQIATDYPVYSSGDSVSAFLKQNVVFDTTLTDTTFRLSTILDSLTKYYWHVSAEDSIGTSGYSNGPLFFFTTGTEITGIQRQQVGIPKKFELYQNYPNPFNPSTKIYYQLPRAEYVTLKIYDVLGNMIKTLVKGYKTKGKYSVNFYTNNLSSGVYFYRLKAGNYTLTKKMIVLK